METRSKRKAKMEPNHQHNSKQASSNIPTGNNKRARNDKTPANSDPVEDSTPAETNQSAQDNKPAGDDKPAKENKPSKDNKPAEDNEPAKSNDPVENIEPQVTAPAPRRYKPSQLSPYCRRADFFVNNKWYPRSNDVPWAGKTFLIFSIQYNQLCTVKETNPPKKHYFRWRVSGHKDSHQRYTGFYLFLNEETGMYMTAEQGKPGVDLTSDRELAAGIIPVRNPVGGYLLQMYRDMKLVTSPVSDPPRPRPNTYEFICVDPPRNSSTAAPA